MNLKTPVILAMWHHFGCVNCHLFHDIPLSSTSSIWVTTKWSSNFARFVRIDLEDVFSLHVFFRFCPRAIGSLKKIVQDIGFRIGFCQFGPCKGSSCPSHISNPTDQLVITNCVASDSPCKYPIVCPETLQFRKPPKHPWNPIWRFHIVLYYFVYCFEKSG